MQDNIPLSRQEVSIILNNWLEIPVNCSSVRKMYGGMIDCVLAVEFDKEPYRAVIKISKKKNFDLQANALNYIKTHTNFPVPEVYFKGYAGEIIKEAFLLIEMLPGINMGDADITPEQHAKLDCQLAEFLLELHSHTRDLYGDIDNQEFHTQWIEWFCPRILYNRDRSLQRLTQRSVEIIPRLIEKLPDLFSNQGKPTLVHGDIWANNIMVEKHNDIWTITGFVDPGVCYADVEMELAYLEVFQTVTDTFYECYHKKQPVREGYPVRKLYYWLNTLLLHVWMFGDKGYINRTEEVAVKLSEMIE